MQKLTDAQSPAVALRALRFAIIRLASRPETAPFAPDLQAARTALASADDALDNARTARVAATAEITWIDERIDTTIIQLGREARALVQGNARDPRYTRLFPIAPSEATRPVGGDTQTRFVTSIIQLLETDDAFASLRPQATPLRELSEQLTAATAARETLYLDENRAASERREAHEVARRAYNLLYPRLLLAFPEDEGLVESFFWRE